MSDILKLQGKKLGGNVTGKVAIYCHVTLPPRPKK